jgi:thioredoxin reductase (NADPH)
VSPRHTFAPSTAELATVAGLSVDPQTDCYDLIVVGGGPAGLGTAVSGASEGPRTVLVERRATGGPCQCRWRCQSAGTRPAGPGAGCVTGWDTGGARSGPCAYSSRV